MDNNDPTPSAGEEVSLVFQNSQGAALQGTVLRLTRYLVAFEVYSSYAILCTSEVLKDFNIVINESTAYFGRAVVTSLVNTGPILVCEAHLDDGWVDIDLFSSAEAGGGLSGRFDHFLRSWQKMYRILPEYKVIVADMQTFLMDMRLWLEQVEMGVLSSPSGNRNEMGLEVARELGKLTTPALTSLFERFEEAAQRIEPPLRAAHRVFGKRQLHPLLLASPFLYRTFHKPLGYAGDYEMVNMLFRDPAEGGSLFGKMLNLWFLHQPPAQAHRNRINFLFDKLFEVTARAAALNRPARILSLGCGPAMEVQRFLREHHLSSRAQFTLLDFNDETVAHASAVLNEARNKHGRAATIKLNKRSVHQILKEAGKSIERSAADQYDFVYCAGLFDYLSDQTCHRLENVLYDWVAPGGLFVVTNVDGFNPRRLTMDYLMEWHLIYRTGAQLAALKPDSVAPGDFSVTSDDTGVNIYFEARKLNHA